MHDRRLESVAAIGLLWSASILVCAQAPAAPGRTSARTTWRAPRTPWGDPDLQGTWNNSTITPLERPKALADKQFLTPEEAAERDQRAEASAEDAPPPGDPGTYNAIWFDRGKSLTRTSLIIDPPDGRLPPYTPEAQRRLAVRAENRRKQGPDPADGPEDRNLAERCITRGAPKLPGG